MLSKIQHKVRKEKTEITHLYLSGYEKGKKRCCFGCVKRNSAEIRNFWNESEGEG